MGLLVRCYHHTRTIWGHHHPPAAGRKGSPWPSILGNSGHGRPELPVSSAEASVATARRIKLLSPLIFPYFLLSPGPSETPNSSLPCSLSSTQVPASPSFPKGLPGWSQHRIHTHFWLVLTCSPTAQPCRCSGETSRLSSVVTQWAYQVSPLWDTGCWLTGEGGRENRGVGTMRVPAC